MLSLPEYAKFAKVCQSMLSLPKYAKVCQSMLRTLAFAIMFVVHTLSWKLFIQMLDNWTIHSAKLILAFYDILPKIGVKLIPSTAAAFLKKV